ncbi:DUF488 domain-containing protein [Specibacter sp. RAF43]|uniref:DUF488 domain-containing protein n=1 Tax=Specibacter sp. RAF43 TaxID=3233057 RepID=UPI003F9AB58D
MDSITIFTVGHSTHPLEEFIALLVAHGVTDLVDVRTVPKSAHNPQFWSEPLAAGLGRAGLGYRHEPALGGLRHAAKDSPNGAWRNASFRGYADYMQTPEFAGAVEHLVLGGRERTTAIMCAEAVPWRCHRSLVGDALLVRGVTVLDIMTEKSAKPHTLTSFARVSGTTVTYPPETPESATA